MDTPQRRANLEKLATYLERLPEDYSHFHMDHWFYAKEKADAREVEIDYALHNGGVGKCGAVACAVGHAPAAGVLVPSYFVLDKHVMWGRFGLEALSGYADNVHPWLFSGYWAGDDNTPQGAAARIRYLLDRGAPPEGFDWNSGESDTDNAAEWMSEYAPYLVTASGIDAATAGETAKTGSTEGESPVPKADAQGQPS